MADAAPRAGRARVQAEMAEAGAARVQVAAAADAMAVAQAARAVAAVKSLMQKKNAGRSNCRRFVMTTSAQLTAA